MPVGATIGAGIGGALISSNATKKASQASTDATNQSLALQQAQFNQTQQNLAPYQAVGQTGLTALTNRVTDPNAGLYGDTTNPTAPTAPGDFSYTAADYHASPGYQFQLDQGLNAIASTQSAKGALGSGATLKALQSYGQGLANQNFNQERSAAQSIYDDNRTNYNTALNQYNTDRNYLTGQYNNQTAAAGNLATIGANAAAGVGTAGLNYANNATNALTNNATTQGNAALTTAGNVNSLLGTGVNALAYQNGQSGIVNALLGKANSAGGVASSGQNYLTNGMFVG